MNYNILDLFSGAGGLSRGMEMVNGFKTRVATDFDKSALETFKFNFPEVETIYGNILDENVKNIITNTAIKEKVNMIIGGPPCQGFSNKGKKLGLNDPRNFLFLEYLDMVKRIQPDIFIIENVKAMLTAVDGYFINEIEKHVFNMGYNMVYGVLTASDFGVPQNRQRAILLASKKNGLQLPNPTNDKKTTVKDAISDLAYLNSGEGSFEQEYRYLPMSKYQKMMRRHSKRLYNHQATTHSPEAVRKLSLIPPEKGKEFLSPELQGKQQFKTTWGRLKWNSQSPTIDTRFDTPSNGTNSHPYLNRAITPREAARIQSFPDDFVFLGKKTYVTKQIGNAVPPLMAKAIAQNIKETSFE